MKPLPNLRHACCLAFFWCAPLAAVEQAARPVYAPPPPAVSAASAAQVVFSLLLVLAAVALAAWLLKRVNFPRQRAGNLLKVVAGVAVGQRERVVLVEVGETWLVVGVAPGQISALHSMPRAELPEAASAAQPGADNKFQTWLKQRMEQRNG
jgi:flagellar protein FliO/FliZ